MDIEAFTALAELHSWLVHCDIAPCHLGRKGGGIAFIDFDAALPHAEAARGGRCVGTDPYIAPALATRRVRSRPRSAGSSICGSSIRRGSRVQ